jgi:hypothetical protein
MGKLEEGKERKRKLPTDINMKLIKVHGYWVLGLDPKVNCLIYCIDTQNLSRVAKRGRPPNGY